MGNKQQHRLRRRLLQNFQYGVGTVIVEGVDRVDNHHPPLAFTGGEGKELRDFTCLINGNFTRFFFFFLIENRFDDQHIRMRTGDDALKNRVLGMNICLARKQHAGKTVGQRCFSNAARAADKPAMRQLATGEIAQQSCFGLFVADQAGIGSWSDDVAGHSA